MTVRSVVANQWKPIVIGAVFLAVEGFAINKVSADNPKWWWWIVAGGALVGVAGCSLWGLLAERSERHPDIDHGDVEIKQQVSGPRATQQSVAGQGQNVNISADNNSVAAYEIKNLNWGTRQGAPDEKEPD